EHRRRHPHLWRYSGLFDRSLRHIDMFISPSRFTLQKHLELGRKLPIVHIPYFLPKTEPQSAEAVSQSGVTDESYFLFVGRLEKIKGLQNVIPLFKKLPQYNLLVA